MNTVSAEQLHQAECAECGDKDPNCRGLVLVGRCHPKAGSKVVYLKREHLLRMTCAVCDKHVIDVQLPVLH